MLLYTSADLLGESVCNYSSCSPLSGLSSSEKSSYSNPSLKSSILCMHGLSSSGENSSLDGRGKSTSLCTNMECSVWCHIDCFKKVLMESLLVPFVVLYIKNFPKMQLIHYNLFCCNFLFVINMQLIYIH